MTFDALLDGDTIHQNCILITEGSLEVEPPTIWADEATGVRAVREKKRREEKRREREEKRKRKRKRREEKRKRKRREEKEKEKRREEKRKRKRREEKKKKKEERRKKIREEKKSKERKSRNMHPWAICNMTNRGCKPTSEQRCCLCDLSKSQVFYGESDGCYNITSASKTSTTYMQEKLPQHRYRE